jgi:hypothetical protein
MRYALLSATVGLLIADQTMAQTSKHIEGCWRMRSVVIERAGQKVNHMGRTLWGNCCSPQTDTSQTFNGALIWPRTPARCRKEVLLRASWRILELTACRVGMLRSK